MYGAWIRKRLTVSSLLIVPATSRGSSEKCFAVLARGTPSKMTPSFVSISIPELELVTAEWTRPLVALLSVLKP